MVLIINRIDTYGTNRIDTYGTNNIHKVRRKYHPCSNLHRKYDPYTTLHGGSSVGWVPNSLLDLWSHPWQYLHTIMGNPDLSAAADDAKVSYLHRMTGGVPASCHSCLYGWTSHKVRELLGVCEIRFWD